MGKQGNKRLTEVEEVCLRGLLGGIEREPRLTVSEWADEYRLLTTKSSAEPGRWRTDRTPYLREIMDCLSVRSGIEQVVVMKGSQVGATEAGNNFLGYVIHHAPGPMLYVLPSLDLARKASKQRIAPMLESTPVLRERLLGTAGNRADSNTVLVKEFQGGYVGLTGANSAAGLRHSSIRFLFMDEVDAYPIDIGKEGDPLELAVKRTATFLGQRKIFAVSTPTLRGFSRIETAFQETDQRYYKVPCPKCGFYQTIEWARIRFNPADSSIDPTLECVECKALISESHKGAMLSAGRWEPTVETDAPETRGYHLSALYSPPGWYSWRHAVTDFMKARRQGAESLKVWTNTVLGETWEEDGESVEDTELAARAETYPAAVPSGGLFLTAGVDTQDDRLEYEVVAWGLGEESWGVTYGVIWGDPAGAHIWDELEAHLSETFEHADGYDLPIAAACIDSGGHYTKQVYDYCRLRQKLRHFAIKGVGGPGKPIVSASQGKRSGRSRRKVDLFLVGKDQGLETVYSRLRKKQTGPGFCHFPKDEDRGYGIEYFRQLTSMKAVTRYTKGIPRREWHLLNGRRAEAIDCRVYALAALYLLRPAWKTLARKRQEQAEKVLSHDGDTAPSITTKEKPQKRPRRRGNSFVSGWKKKR